MQRWLAMGLVVGVSGCLPVEHHRRDVPGARHHKEGARPVHSDIELRLIANPPRLSMSERDRFHVGLSATNMTSAAIDPELYRTRLLVNGVPSVAYDLALGNSVMPAKWDRLPGGDTTPPALWPLGKALFPAPGEYSLVLRLEREGRPPIEDSATVTVTP